ncbi:DUF2314 domain-containing protein [Thalassolituus sp. C2-1]|uniref:DUF2314 domain-containing protein n=1 Tax=Venatorbacter sp. C2-1 TaxID=2597518 RepID=UPI00118EA4D7|nr:DUF2314 domain-containing protein [Thalassolituus sp. C2-1]TVV43676.1 DUF2314 domain-containing protein [Thalassolituus sp. C2-1]
MELAKFEKNGYELDDGEMLHAEAPETFYIPEINVRNNLSVGDCVKLVFRMDQPKLDDISVERMWVEITDVKEGFYIGFLDNDPVGEVTIKCNDTVVFQPKHIIAIYE